MCRLLQWLRCGHRNVMRRMERHHAIDDLGHVAIVTAWTAGRGAMHAVRVTGRVRAEFFVTLDARRIAAIFLGDQPLRVATVWRVAVEAGYALADLSVRIARRAQDPLIFVRRQPRRAIGPEARCERYVAVRRLEHGRLRHRLVEPSQIVARVERVALRQQAFDALQRFRDALTMTVTTDHQRAFVRELPRRHDVTARSPAQVPRVAIQR